MKTRLLAGLVGALVVFGSVAAQGATETQKQTAIDNGLAYLASTQQVDGRWEYGDEPSDTGATGALLYAFIEEGYTAGTDVVFGATNYGDVVGDGLSYLFSKAATYAIFNELAGNPDSDGDGLGVKFVLGGNNNRDTYVTGLAATAIAATGTPGAVVTTGALTGQTYGEVMQDTMDYFSYGQADAGTWGRGGWRYYADYGEADNSTAQWPIIAALLSNGNMGHDMRPFVKTELDFWISYIQNADGGSDYDGSWNQSNMSRTGALLIEMAYAGYPTGTAAERQAFQDALDYVNNQWQTSANATWNGNFGHPYAMWGVYKGLETTIGLDDTAAITNLRTFDGSTMELDPGDTWNWWEDYCEYLVDTQAAGGSWAGYASPYWVGPMATAWYVNILAATEIPPPTVIPEPVTMAGLALGIGGLVTYIRRRR